MPAKKFITVVQRRIIEGDESAIRMLEPLFAIETHMSMEERLRLFSVANGLRQGFVACEIGSYLGASTCFLGVAARSRGGVIHCVDTWDNRAMGLELRSETFSAFTRNVEPFRGNIVVHRGESATMAPHVPAQLDLLFIDGDHSYAGTKADLAHYGPKLKAGGLLLLHDYTYPEVRQACGEYLATRRARDLGHIHSLQVFQTLGV
ncbi:MAG TPA: class I SAM-dependent methyltransferase [Humisphaera sp.]|nr:class I SAM-dependent methyltransferase [Humisphaera sp.]